MHEEDMCHLFFECPKIAEIWTDIETLLTDIILENVTLEFQDVIFGVYFEELKEKNHLINLIILEVKWQIWKNRNSVKYGNKTSLTKEHLLNKIKLNSRNEAKLFLKGEEKNVIKQKVNFLFDSL